MAQDTFGRKLRDLRISVTDRCNFRCPYCMPAEHYGEAYSFLPRKEILDFEEISRLAGLIVGLGTEKIRLSGGEPLLREDLPTLVSQLAAIDGASDLALTTNGSLLAGNAAALAKAGLKRVTVSLDSLDEQIFLSTNGGSFGVERVLEGIRAAESAGLSPIKVNAVIMRGVNESSIVELARRFRGTGHILRFIEFMDVGNINEWNLERVVPASEILARLRKVYPLEPVEAGYRGEVARRYRYTDGGGEVGLIGSVTRPFCGDCTRLRLSTDGMLFTCLFGTHGTDLKAPMRAGASDRELVEIITACWAKRDDRYSEQRASMTRKVNGKIEMYQIGG